MLDHSQQSSVAIPEVVQPTTNKSSDLPFVPELSFLAERVYRDERGEFRIPVVIYGEDLWFFGKEAAEVLGYALVDSALRDHAKNKFVVRKQDLDKINKPADSAGLNFPSRGRTLIQESDFNYLIQHSQTPYALQVQKWINEVVLPSIRRSGTYNFSQTPQLSPQERKVVEIESATKIAKVTFDLFHNVWGIGNSESIIHSSKAAENSTGISLLAMAGIEALPAPDVRSSHTPTEISKLIGAPSAQRVNIMLSDLEFQVRTGKKYEPTEKGLPYADKRLVTAPHMKTAKQQLCWYSDIVPILQEEWDRIVAANPV